MIVLVVLLIGIFLIFYYTLKDKVKDVSNQQPFSEIVGKTLTLQRPVTLVKNDVGSGSVRDYQLYDAADEFQGMTDDDKIIRIPVAAGTKINIKSVKMIKNAVSGFSRPYVIGTIQLPESGEVVEFDYSWGKQSIEKLFDKIDKRWSFPLAVWETEINTEVYALPEP